MTDENKPKLTLKLGSDKLKIIQTKLKLDTPKPAKVKKVKMPREEYKEVLDLVRQKFSKAFPRAVDPIKMLKNGIHKDISKKLNIEEEKIHRFLYVYVRKKKYTLGMKLGAPRHDLKGNIISYVLKEEMNKPPKKKRKITQKPKQD